MTHEEYWMKVREKAHDRLDSLFDGCDHDVAAIVHDGNGIDSYSDAKAVLGHAIKCADTAEEEACAILSVFECVMAWHEMNEHAMTGVMVK